MAAATANGCSTSRLIKTEAMIKSKVTQSCQLTPWKIIPNFVLSLPYSNQLHENVNLTGLQSGLDFQPSLLQESQNRQAIEAPRQ